MVTAYITHTDCLKHTMGAHHPERPVRMSAIDTALRQSPIWKSLREYSPLEVESASLLRAHNALYLEKVEKLAPHENQDDVSLDPDTSLNPYSLRAARLAAGAGVMAVDLVMKGEVTSAFCNVRPPGHHAEHDRAMGFCIYNNVAVAAAHALAAHDLKRVAIVDFDVHHGNGTEDIFKDDERVMLLSSFQYPFYPGSSLGQMGRNENIIKSPMSWGEGSEEFRAIVNDSWLPRLTRFKPQMIFFSAGFDAHREDAMSGINFVDDDYAFVTRAVADVARETAQNRMVSMLEGGYDLDSLARSAVVHVGEII